MDIYYTKDDTVVKCNKCQHLTGCGDVVGIKKRFFKYIFYCNKCIKFTKMKNNKIYTNFN